MAYVQLSRYQNIIPRTITIFLVWILCRSLCYSFPATDDYFDNSATVYSLGAPLITPTAAEITLEANSNYTLQCESKEPIKWIIPELFENPLLYREEPYPTQDPVRPYGNQLVLYNVSAYNVGYYYCINEGVSDNINFLDEQITQFKASKIYIFVNDLETLLAPLEHPIVQAFQYSDVIVPCKPTSKDVEVELKSTANDERTLHSNDSKYDPKIGFIVKIVHLSDGGDYSCRAIRDMPGLPKEQEEYIHILVLPSVTGSINRPVITSEDRGHAYEGNAFNLTCIIEVIPNLLFNISWETPNNNIAIKEQRAFIHPTIKYDSSDMLMNGKSVITVYNANKKKDSGVYKCNVEDNSKNKNSNTFRMLILGQNEHYITLNEASNNTYIRKVAGKNVQIVVYYNGYPMPSIRWYNKDNIPIPATTPHGKYTITQSERDTILRIRNVTLKDSGIYVVKATNGIDNEELKFNLSVKDKPTISTDNVYIQTGEEASVICRSDAFPPATISWSFTPCKIQPKWPTCFRAKTQILDNILSYSKEESENTQVSELRFKPTEPGLITCTAKNELGQSSKDAELLIGDLVQPIVVYGVEDGRQIAVGDEITLTCGALAYNYSADLYWYQDNILVQPTKDIELKNLHSEYSYKKILKFKNIQRENAASYECRVRPIMDDGSGRYESRILQIKVHDPLAPIMDTTNLMDGRIDTNLGDKLSLQCKASGIPKPTVTWHKDDVAIGSTTTDESNYILEEDGTILNIQFVKPENEGTYKCLVSNRLGTIERSAQLKISNMPGLRLGWIFAIIAVIAILIILIIYLCIRVIRKGRLLREMKAAGLANFEEGALECINPALSLDEQADLLPYDRRFEFPREKLKLGKQLGAGAFGVVLKGVAEGILPDEKETTVAVKMVKKTADNEVMKALVSELKIMVHLGQHLNVVNLLGAVTKNIAKREVMVIVEYCRYGNVQNFLLKNRKRFINQINPNTDQIDPTITTRDSRWSSDYEYNSNGKGDNDRRSTGLKVGPNSTGYIRQSELYVGGNMDSCNTEQTLISSVHEGDESVILSNNSVQPAWRSNYRPDGSTVMDITTTHLISWAFQVARGMDYLASRKVLHGDLAARNILLCDDNVVKICDFGLARSMYRSDNYKKQGEAPLPIKWLALESLGDQVFSTYSDIWSFGIVLWEFFSLAKVPYPGMEADQSLYMKLKNGYRMEKPEYANQELYDIMLECWSTNPESRPLFSDLERKFAKLLEDEVTNHYIDLNEPYLRMNSEYLKNDQTDYLALMGCPEEQAPQPPRYVNGNLVTEIRNDEDNQQSSPKNSAYLHMSPKSSNVIFSPRPHDDYVKSDHFKFPPDPVSPTISNNLDSPMMKQRTKKTGIPEEIPMLNNSQYDSELELSPDPKMDKQQNQVNKNFSNIKETNLSTDDNNYVNLNTNINKNLNLNDSNINDILRKKHINGSKDAFSNPGYQILTAGGDKK